MKLNYILASAIIAGSTLGLASCGDKFLEEDQFNQRSTQYFTTQSGLDDLVTGAYQKLKFKFNYQWGYLAYCMGIDEFTGGANNLTNYNAYQTLDASEGNGIKPIWDNYYGLVEPANVIIQNVPLYYDKANAKYNTRLGEGYFLRAYAYFELVKQFGGVPLKLNPSKSVETYFTRNTLEECYAQIIADFEQAYNLLPETPEQTGRITKSAAAHFLAKAHLFRASELYDDWNGSYKSDDLDAVIKYGKEVIAAHPLCADYVALWDYTKANSANETVSEVVLAAQFSDDTDTWGRFGNQMHLCFPSVYQNMAGMKRDISGDREFSYVSATEYTMQVFDRVNDSRFWKSFITTYGCNNPSAAPKWSVYAKDYPNAIPDGVNAAGARFAGGQIALKYIVNSPGDTRYTDIDGKKSEDGVLKNGKLEAPHTFVHYYAGEDFSWNTSKATTTGNWFAIRPHNRSVALSKYRDGYRNAINSQFGTRDAIIARSADDVLMVAEAYIRKKDYANAITYLNMVRDRAGYAEGEDRAKHVDGGQSYKNNSYCSGKGGGFSADGAIYYETNTYYESNNMDVTTASSKSSMRLNSVADILNSAPDMPVYQALGLSSDYDKVMCFLMNERTRELCGEMQRWEDLARTKTLEARWNTFNDAKSYGEGSFNAQRDYYRPLPQSFLDGITNASGNTLSDEEKSAMQNPGY